MQTNPRKNSIAIQGGAFGDEGKGRIVDNLCQRFSKKYKKIIVYRWNGGANAGHTVQFGNQRIALHQLPSGVFIKNAVVILGKGMVIHPGDLLTEINQVKKYSTVLNNQNLILDEMATLSLDTHRGFESTLKIWEEGGRGSTGRGISPAYADVLLRHPVRMRDLTSGNWKNIFSKHYDLYAALIKGLGQDMSKIDVASIESPTGSIKIGSKITFLKRINKQRLSILKFISPVFDLLDKSWKDEGIPFVFEGAQAVGLDARYGVYPDITASDPTFDGILSSTEGIIDPSQIQIRASTIKATYMSSVGQRKLPTVMHPALAELIRREAKEYGAITKRPRDIYHLDLPAIGYFLKVTKTSHLILTHMDISYPNIPLSICYKYLINGKPAFYRPCQMHLNKIKPVYKEMRSWDGTVLHNCKKISEFPTDARNFLNYLKNELHIPIFAITTGPDREDILFNNLNDM